MTQAVSVLFGKGVGSLFGGGGDDSGIQAQLKAQQDAQAQSLATSVNAQADSAQDLARGSRVRGGRNLLSYLGAGGGTLG